MNYELTYWTPPDGEHKLVVSYEDGTVKEYTMANKEQYAVDFPDRLADIVAMQWGA
jgi:hypothetical protein